MGGFGPGGFGPGGFGRGGFRGGHGWGPFFGGMFGRGQRARRGNVRTAILSLLAGQELNGYQIMQAIEQRSQGNWRPSSGSIYPTLQQLEDEGMVEAEEARPGQGGSRTYKLTAKGRRYVDDNRAELDAEWAAVSPGDEAGGDGRWEIMQVFGQLAGAAAQVAQAGTAAQVEEAKRLLQDVRRSLYRILAEVPDDDAGEAGEPGAPDADEDE